MSAPSGHPRLGLGHTARVTSPRIGDVAEARVARYLREQGYTFEVEPEFGTGRHPDYLITAGEHTVVAETWAAADSYV